MYAKIQSRATLVLYYAIVHSTQFTWIQMLPKMWCLESAFLIVFILVAVFFTFSHFVSYLICYHQNGRKNRQKQNWEPNKDFLYTRSKRWPKTILVLAAVAFKQWMPIDLVVFRIMSYNAFHPLLSLHFAKCKTSMCPFCDLSSFFVLLFFCTVCSLYSLLSSAVCSLDLYQLFSLLNVYFDYFCVFFFVSHSYHKIYLEYFDIL